MKMMKFFLLAAAAVAAISCAKENLPVENETPTPEVELVPMTFTASYAETDDAETKVALENGATVWKPGDKIMVISNTGTTTEFEATEVTNEGKTATFDGLTENADEYYAVYPASAYKGSASYVTDPAGGKLVVEVPQVQQAVAGTFHESALLCIANTKGSTFQFKHSCAFLKFNLAAPEGVKSIRLKVNGSTNVAGVGYVGVNATDMNPKYASSDANMSAYDMITLNAPEGGFVAGENYYIAMRANSCPDGITAYIEYTDNVKARTRASQVFTDGSIAKGPYSKLFVIGNSLDSKTNITLTEQVRYSTNGIIGFKNLAFAQYSTDMFVHNNTAEATRFAFDNCDIITPTSNGVMYNGESRTLAEFAMYNCNIKVTKDSHIFLRTSANYSNIDLHNNIFYSAEGDKMDFYLINYSSNATENLKLTQNTFANVYNITATASQNPYINVASVANYTLENNLFYLEYYNTYGNPISWILSCIPTTYSINNNMLFKDVNNQRLQVYKSGAYTSYTATKSNVVTGDVDLTVPTIVPATAAGATRQT